MFSLWVVKFSPLIHKGDFCWFIGVVYFIMIIFMILHSWWFTISGSWLMINHIWHDTNQQLMIGIVDHYQLLVIRLVLRDQPLVLSLPVNNVPVSWWWVPSPRRHRYHPSSDPARWTVRMFLQRSQCQVASPILSSRNHKLLLSQKPWVEWYRNIDTGHDKTRWSWGWFHSDSYSNSTVIVMVTLRAL